MANQEILVVKSINDKSYKNLLGQPKDQYVWFHFQEDQVTVIGPEYYNKDRELICVCTGDNMETNADIIVQALNDKLAKEQQ